MKVHNIAILTSLSILPMHQSFAVGINQVGLSQTTSNKATMVMPIKKASTNKVIKPLKIGTAQLSAPANKAVVVNLKPPSIETYSVVE